MTPESGGREGSDETDMSDVAPPVIMTEAEAQAPAADTTVQASPQGEGRRTQLKIVRESIHALSTDVGNFRRSHGASIKKLEKQVAALRSELAAQAISKDIGSFRKSHEASAKRLEKQVATLRKDLAALKSSIAKDAARSRAKEEATLSRILAKVGAKKPKPSTPKPSKSAKKR